jgi:signal transduction histidine kinase
MATMDVALSELVNALVVAAGFGGGALLGMFHTLRHRHRSSALMAAGAHRERRRIARELHDIMGHRLLVIGMHAAELRTVAPHASVAAQAIEHLARTAQQEVRELLSTLRASDTPSPTDDVAVSTAVSDLCLALRHDPLSVRFQNIELEPQLDARLRHTVLRIVQESITNALKYGEGPIHVLIEFGGQVVVTVVNGLPDGAVGQPEARPEHDSFGLVGMRERVEANGGSFSCGMVAKVGFVVRACLPVSTSTSATRTKRAQ